MSHLLNLIMFQSNKLNLFFKLSSHVRFVLDFIKIDRQQQRKKNVWQLRLSRVEYISHYLHSVVIVICEFNETKNSNSTEERKKLYNKFSMEIGTEYKVIERIENIWWEMRQFLDLEMTDFVVMIKRKRKWLNSNQAIGRGKKIFDFFHLVGFSIWVNVWDLMYCTR